MKLVLLAALSALVWVEKSVIVIAKLENDEVLWTDEVVAIPDEYDVSEIYASMLAQEGNVKWVLLAAVSVLIWVKKNVVVISGQENQNSLCTHEVCASLSESTCESRLAKEIGGYEGESLQIDARQNKFQANVERKDDILGNAALPAVIKDLKLKAHDVHQESSTKEMRLETKQSKTAEQKKRQRDQRKKRAQKMAVKVEPTQVEPSQLNSDGSTKIDRKLEKQEQSASHTNDNKTHLSKQTKEDPKPNKRKDKKRMNLAKKNQKDPKVKKRDAHRQSNKKKKQTRAQTKAGTVERGEVESSSDNKASKVGKKKQDPAGTLKRAGKKAYPAKQKNTDPAHTPSGELEQIKCEKGVPDDVISIKLLDTAETIKPGAKDKKKQQKKPRVTDTKNDKKRKRQKEDPSKTAKEKQRPGKNNGSKRGNKKKDPQTQKAKQKGVKKKDGDPKTKLSLKVKEEESFRSDQEDDNKLVITAALPEAIEDPNTKDRNKNSKNKKDPERRDQRTKSK